MAFVSLSFWSLWVVSTPIWHQNCREARGASQGPVLPRFCPAVSRAQSVQHSLREASSVGLSHYIFYTDGQHPSWQGRGHIHFISCWSKYVLENFSYLKHGEFSCNHPPPKKKKRKIKPFRVLLIFFPKSTLDMRDMWCVFNIYICMNMYISTWLICICM